MHLKDEETWYPRISKVTEALLDVVDLLVSVVNGIQRLISVLNPVCYRSPTLCRLPEMNVVTIAERLPLPTVSIHTPGQGRLGRWENAAQELLLCSYESVVWGLT